MIESLPSIGLLYLVAGSVPARHPDGTGYWRESQSLIVVDVEVERDGTNDVFIAVRFIPPWNTSKSKRVKALISRRFDLDVPKTDGPSQSGITGHMWIDRCSWRDLDAATQTLKAKVIQVYQPFVAAHVARLEQINLLTLPA